MLFEKLAQRMDQPVRILLSLDIDSFELEGVDLRRCFLAEELFLPLFLRSLDPRVVDLDPGDEEKEGHDVFYIEPVVLFADVG